MMTRRLCLLLTVSLAWTALTDGVDARLATNRLATNRLATNRLATNRLATNALTSSSLETTLATTELLSTESGREVYSYVVSCALPAGKSLQAIVADAPDTAPPDTNYTCTNGTCTFDGNVGLAEYWLDRRLDRKGQRWITACLLARINHYQITKAVSLRGVAPQLTVGPSEVELFPLEEGAFFGNLFTDEDEIDWNACRGQHSAEAAAGLRDCTAPDPSRPGYTMCGLKDAGDCRSFSTESPSEVACRSYDGDDGTYGDCHAAGQQGQPYREVITTYLSE